MEFKEFAIYNQKIALLIHGGYVSWKTLNVQITELQRNYHVIVPILDGHNINDDSELVSIEDEASKILRFFKDRDMDHINVIYGASLGADIAIEILCQNGAFSEYAFIESGSLGIPKFASIPLIKISEVAMYQGVRGNKYWERFIEDFISKLHMSNELYEDTKQVLANMSKRTVRNVQKLVCNYRLKDTVKNINTKCLVVYTAKEKAYMKKPYEKMARYVQNMRITCIKDYNHGQLCIGNPYLQLKMLSEFVEEKSFMP